MNFRCMVWSLVVLGSISAVPVWGVAADEFALEEMVVSATRVETPKQDVAANVTVLTRKDLDTLPAATVAEALQYVPGVYVEFNGGPGAGANIRIHGSDFRHVAVYRDGDPMNPLANPMADLSGIALESVEKIEIYKGAASSAWGSALGGVVNIITKAPEPGKTQVSGSVSAGEFGTVKASSEAGGSAGPVDYLVSLSRNESRGFMDHTDYGRTDFSAKVSRELGEASSLGATYGYTEGNNADPMVNWADYSSDPFWDDLWMQRIYEQVRFDTAPSDRFRISLEGHHHDAYTKIDDVYAGYRAVYNDYREELYGGSARASYTAGKNSVTAGMDADSGEYEWIWYDDTYKTETVAVYGNDTFTYGPVSLNAGLRYDHDKNFDAETSPSAGVVYRFSQYGALLRAQVAKGFSAPPAAWIYDPRYGNKDLKAETAVNYQFGGEVKPMSWLVLEGSLFRADVDDLIKRVKEPDGTKQYQNIDRVKRQGGEAAIRTIFKTGLSAGLTGYWAEVRDETTGKILEDIPRTTYTASLGYGKKWFSGSLVGKYIDHNSSYPETRDERFVFDAIFKVTPARLSSLGKPTFFVNIYDLFDSNYLYQSVWPQPGRWVEGGVRFSF